MKIKITETEIIKNTSKVADVIQSNGNSYKVLSITLKKKNNNKTLFI
jgi:hypothetical protein